MDCAGFSEVLARDSCAARSFARLCDPAALIYDLLDQMRATLPEEIVQPAGLEETVSSLAHDGLVDRIGDRLRASSAAMRFAELSR